MKNIIILNVLFLSMFASTVGLSQTYEVEWNYCPDIKVAKIGTKLLGVDTLSIYHVFQGATITDSLFLKEGGDTTFLYFNNTFYFLYTNNAQLGDLWHPLRFEYKSYSNTCGSLMDLVVIHIDSILINGEWLNSFVLEDLTYYPMGMRLIVIEKIGVLNYTNNLHDIGMLYNSSPLDCVGSYMYNFSSYRLMSYHSQALNYDYLPVQNSCFAEINSNYMQNEPKVLQKDNRIEVIWNDKDVELELYNISGQKIKSIQKNTLNLPQEQGIYFLHIQQNTISRMVKLAN